MQSIKKTTERLLECLAKSEDSMLEMLREIISIESPTGDQLAQRKVFDLIDHYVRPLGYGSHYVPIRGSAGLMVYMHRGSKAGLGEKSKQTQVAYSEESDPFTSQRGSFWSGKQLILGHVDTVWPHGTLKEMPVRQMGRQLYGPGVFDMKGGIVQAVFALDALHKSRLTPLLQPILVLNSEEEIGSPHTRRHLERYASCCERVFVLEPPVGDQGKLKTERKGGGFFCVRIQGRAAHAGLNPDYGRNAIERMVPFLKDLRALSTRFKYLQLNFGTIKGGVAANVVAPSCELVVDVRASSPEELKQFEHELQRLPFEKDGYCLTIESDLARPPMVRNSRNQQLWDLANQYAPHLGFTLQQASVGGGSDGNFTSQSAATLDGLGAVGGGAHQPNEHIHLDEMPKRAALLAALLLAPATPSA